MKLKQRIIAYAFFLLPIAASAYYSPEQGRWLSRDPIEEKGAVNLQGFVKNVPISRLDPLGKSCLDPCGLAKAMGLGSATWREQGGVICCGGKKYACVWSTTPYVQKAKDIVWKCTFDHEWKHRDDVPDCPPCSFVPTRPDFKIPVSKYRAECQAWRVTVNCLQDALASGACGDEPLCPILIRGAIKNAEAERDEHCRKGGL
jgi:hypothetical protein